MPMRLAKCQSGQVVVLTMLIFPVLVVLMVFAVNYAALVHSKIRLQIAADRAIFAGAAKLSYIMNQIAQENWAINRAFRKVEDNFDPNSQQSTGECDQRVTEMLNTQTTAGDKIRAMIDGAYGEASVVVNDVLAANYPGASFTPIFGSAGEPLLDVIDIGDEYGEQRRDITCSNISGFVFSPEGYESKTKAKHLRYLFMSPESFVGLAGMFEADFAALFLPGLFGKIGLKAVSAGQPYGGSIKHFALIEKDKVEEAIGEAQGLAEDGGAYWYRPALVPLERFYERIGMEMPDGEIYYH